MCTAISASLTSNRSAVQQRCVDTTTFFVRGYLSHGNYVNDTKVNRGTIITLPDSVNTTFADSLTPSASCPAYYDANNGSAISNAYRSLYQERIADRLNLYLDGLVLDPTDIGVMQDLCGFSNEINGDKRWCNLFTGELVAFHSRTELSVSVPRRGVARL